jgi:hypothetical protein
MRPDGGVRQRGLVDRRIVFADSERTAGYVFPFIDRRWRVPFLVVDLAIGPPMVLDGPFRVDQFRFRTALRIRDLRRIESVSLEDLEQLVHYDPWWVFRRASGVSRAWVDAVLATNIAAPFRHGGRKHTVRDLLFSTELDRLEGIEVRSGLFRAVTFRPGDIDLRTLRPARSGPSNRRTARAAKAL